MILFLWCLQKSTLPKLNVKIFTVSLQKASIVGGSEYIKKTYSDLSGNKYHGYHELSHFFTC
jgi:hypothetical protein